MSNLLNLQLWIITGHTCLHFYSNSNDLIAVSRDAQGRLASQFLFNATFGVDTFFMLSSFLAAYLFLDSFNKAKAAEEKSGKKKREPNVFLWSSIVYFHRYVRLTPLYLIVLLFWTYVLPLTFQGYYEEAYIVCHVQYDTCVCSIVDACCFRMR